jgi:peptide chain release factor
MIRLLLTSGRGPAECRIALTKTIDILVREAEVAGVTVDVTVGPDPDGHGPASAIALIEGEGEDAFVATWIDSILWVVQSPLRPHHKRKNWFIGVFRLDGSHLSRYRSNWPTRASKRVVLAARVANTRTRPRAR